MNKLAPQGGYKYSGTELGLLNPESTMYELRTGNSYPWMGNSSTGMGVAPTPNMLGRSSFGLETPPPIIQPPNCPCESDFEDDIEPDCNRCRDHNCDNWSYYCPEDDDTTDDEADLTDDDMSGFGYKLAPQGGYKYSGTELGLINPASTMYELRTGNSYPWLGKSSTGRGVAPTPNILGRSSFGAKAKGKKVVGYTLKKGRVVTVYKFKGMVGKRYYDKKKVPSTKKVYKRKSDVKKKKTITRKPVAKKTTTGKKLVGYTLKGGGVVSVYKFNGLAGKRYSDGTKIPKGKKVALKKSGVSKKRKSSKTISTYYMFYDRDGVEKRRKYINECINCSKNTNSTDCYGNTNCYWNNNNRCVKRYGKIYQGPKRKDSKFGSGVINPANRTNYALYQYANNAATPSLKDVNRLSGVSTYSYPVSSKMDNYSNWDSKVNLSGMGF